MHARDGNLSRLICSAALDCRRYDLTRRLVGLGTYALLGITEDLRLVAYDVSAHAVENLAMGIFLGQG